jgi:hypothetical protein
MSQYTILSDTESITIADGVGTYRIRVDGDDLLYEKRVAGDWVVIDTHSLPGTNESEFRLGVRSGYWNEEQAMTAIGFSGNLGIDYDIISRHKTQ